MWPVLFWTEVWPPERLNRSYSLKHWYAALTRPEESRPDPTVKASEQLFGPVSPIVTEAHTKRLQWCVVSTYGSIHPSSGSGLVVGITRESECMELPRRPPATVKRLEAFVAEMVKEQRQIQGPPSDHVHARQHRSRGLRYRSYHGPPKRLGPTGISLSFQQPKVPGM